MEGLFSSKPSLRQSSSDVKSSTIQKQNRPPLTGVLMLVDYFDRLPKSSSIERVVENVTYEFKTDNIDDCTIHDEDVDNIYTSEKITAMSGLDKKKRNDQFVKLVYPELKKQMQPNSVSVITDTEMVDLFFVSADEFDLQFFNWICSISHFKPTFGPLFLFRIFLDNKKSAPSNFLEIIAKKLELNIDIFNFWIDLFQHCFILPVTGRSCLVCELLGIELNHSLSSDCLPTNNSVLYGRLFNILIELFELNIPSYRSYFDSITPANWTRDLNVDLPWGVMLFEGFFDDSYRKNLPQVWMDNLKTSSSLFKNFLGNEMLSLSFPDFLLESCLIASRQASFVHVLKIYFQNKNWKAFEDNTLKIQDFVFTDKQKWDTFSKSLDKIDLSHISLKELGTFVISSKLGSAWQQQMFEILFPKIGFRGNLEYNPSFFLSEIVQINDFSTSSISKIFSILFDHCESSFMDTMKTILSEFAQRYRSTRKHPYFDEFSKFCKSRNIELPKISVANTIDDRYFMELNPSSFLKLLASDQTGSLLNLLKVDIKFSFFQKLTGEEMFLLCVITLATKNASVFAKILCEYISRSDCGDLLQIIKAQFLLELNGKLNTDVYTAFNDFKNKGNQKHLQPILNLSSTNFSLSDSIWIILLIHCHKGAIVNLSSWGWSPPSNNSLRYAFARMRNVELLKWAFQNIKPLSYYNGIESSQRESQTSVSNFISYYTIYSPLARGLFPPRGLDAQSMEDFCGFVPSTTGLAPVKTTDKQKNQLLAYIKAHSEMEYGSSILKNQNLIISEIDLIIKSSENCFWLWGPVGILDFGNGLSPLIGLFGTDPLLISIQERNIDLFSLIVNRRILIGVQLKCEDLLNVFNMITEKKLADDMFDIFCSSKLSPPEKIGFKSFLLKSGNFATKNYDFMEYLCFRTKSRFALDLILGQIEPNFYLDFFGPIINRLFISSSKFQLEDKLVHILKLFNPYEFANFLESKPDIMKLLFGFLFKLNYELYDIMYALVKNRTTKFWMMNQVDLKTFVSIIFPVKKTTELKDVVVNIWSEMFSPVTIETAFEREAYSNFQKIGGLKLEALVDKFELIKNQTLFTSFLGFKKTELVQTLSLVIQRDPKNHVWLSNQGELIKQSGIIPIVEKVAPTSITLSKRKTTELGINLPQEVPPKKRTPSSKPKKEKSIDPNVEDNIVISVPKKTTTPPKKASQKSKFIPKIGGFEQFCVRHDVDNESSTEMSDYTFDFYPEKHYSGITMDQVYRVCLWKNQNESRIYFVKCSYEQVLDPKKGFFFQNLWLIAESSLEHDIIEYTGLFDFSTI